MNLNACRVTIEAKTLEGETVLVTVERDWTSDDALFPPAGMDPLTYVVGDAVKRTRAGLGAGKGEPAPTFGEGRERRAKELAETFGGGQKRPACSRTWDRPSVACEFCGASAGQSCVPLASVTP